MRTGVITVIFTVTITGTIAIITTTIIGTTTATVDVIITPILVYILTEVGLIIIIMDAAAAVLLERHLRLQDLNEAALFHAAKAKYLRWLAQVAEAPAAEAVVMSSHHKVEAATAEAAVFNHRKTTVATAQEVRLRQIPEAVLRADRKALLQHKETP